MYPPSLLAQIDLAKASHSIQAKLNPNYSMNR
jgi:hypothetical protein